MAPSDYGVNAAYSSLGEKRYPSPGGIPYPSPRPDIPVIRPTFSRGPPSVRSQAVGTNESAYAIAVVHRSHHLSVASSEKFDFPSDPKAWGSNLSPNIPEPDDDLHDPDKLDGSGTSGCDTRGLANIGCLMVVGVLLLGLFLAYPVVLHYTRPKITVKPGFNASGTNASGQIPSMGNWGLIDLDTPQAAYTIPSFHDPSVELQLVFSDEFEVEGRSFYPGDDPYFEAVDLHYWQTGNLEWYDPAGVATKGGALELTLSERQTHNLSYQGGMVTSWNKFCFTGGMIQASVTLPGANNVAGLWPAVWTMGNLGRAGYGASLEGMWPYTYDTCDVGTAPNQTLNGAPQAATINGDQYNGGVLSFQPGQRLSRCTCPGESHPGPMHQDGTFVGRSAPEIDIFEAQTGGPSSALYGTVSQSAQWAPFNNAYAWYNTSDNMVIADTSISEKNTYPGGVYQEATSVVSKTNQDCYELTSGCFSVYGFEYQPGYDNAYITWIRDDQVAWTLNQAAMAKDPIVEIEARPIPQEPLYIIANLGMSHAFGAVDLDHLTFPTTMRIDYIRVYQPKDAINIGCDPADFPTADYIDTYAEAYNNPLLTTWVNDYKQPFPKNSFVGEC